MSKGTSDFVEFVKEQLHAVHAFSTTRMFGGVGLTSSGIQFGMIMSNSLYFVVDDETRPAYEKMGSSCFSYVTRKGRINVKRYYEVPAEAIEEPDRLIELATSSIAIASRPKSTKKSS